MELCEQSMQVFDDTEQPQIQQQQQHKSRAPQKRKMLTIAEKMDIINAIKSGASNSSICKEKQLKSSSVSSIWKSRETIIAAFECNKSKAKRLRLCDKSDLEELLATWARGQMRQNILITRSMITEKAEEFAEKLGYTNYKCNNSWLDRFKARNSITCGKTYERKKQSITNCDEEIHQTTEVVDVVTNDQVQNALDTLFLFYKTNDVSREFQRNLLKIKTIVNDYFMKNT